jgi:hypothetical protein
MGIVSVVAERGNGQNAKKKIMTTKIFIVDEKKPPE